MRVLVSPQHYHQSECVILYLLIFVNLIDKKWYLHVVLIFTSFISEFEHLSICIKVILIFFFVWIVLCLFWLILPREYFFHWSLGVGRHWYQRDSSIINWLPPLGAWDQTYNPGLSPGLGMELETLWCEDQCSSHWDTLARALTSF